MKLKFSWVCCVLTAVGLWAAPAPAALVDGVVATVDNEVILHSDLLEEAGPLLASLQTTQGSSPEFQRELDRALREALDLVIERKLLYRQAQLAGMEVTDAQVDDRVEMIRREYRSDPEFQRMTQEAGAMSEFRARLRQQVMALSMARSKQQQFEREVVISESDLRQYYQDNMDEFSNQERVRISRIFIPAEDPQERQRARARLESLRSELNLGADFAGLARQHSEGPEAAAGGVVGWVSRGDLVDAIDQAAFSLPVGEVSDVLETDFGLVLVKVEERSEGGATSYDQVRTEIEPLLRAKHAQERYKKWVEELRKRSRVIVHL
jgi:parvulin-like peptidyl-prolyl isomerase